MAKGSEKNHTVSARADLRISLSPCGTVVVGDRNARGGGNVRARGGKWLSWTNETGKPCTLSFEEFPELDEAGDPAPVWPFVEGASGRNGRVIIKSGKSWSGRLPRGIHAAIKYSIKVGSGKRASMLDPVIIIEK